MSSADPRREDAPPQDSGAKRRLIEIGWMVVGALDEPDRQAVDQARETFAAYLRSALPQFDWRVLKTRHEDLAQTLKAEPVRLFELGRSERDLRRWDYCILLTGADVQAHRRPSAFAAFSSALGLAVVSTARIDPKAQRADPTEEERIDAMAGRTVALVLHCFGHLMGLRHSSDPTNSMCPFETLAELDQRREFDDEQLAHSLKQLREVADERLEERVAPEKTFSLFFYLRSILINRREIVRAVWRAEPWLFPLRLSRLAAAAISAAAVLLLTAEVWELGTSLPLYKSMPFAAVCLAATTAFVVIRQGLLVRREQPGFREQKVVANVAAVVIVAVGLAVTFLILFALALALAILLFDPKVQTNWAAAVETIGIDERLSLSIFIASVGMAIGALGASFENQLYFRHVTFVDEEV